MAFLMALGWGVVSGVLSPCMWVVFPIVLSYVAYETADGKQSKAQGFFLSATFALGMSVMFAVFGGAVSIVGNFFRMQEQIIAIVAGLVLIAIGLGFLGAYEFRVPGFLNMNLTKPKSRGILGALVLGVFGAILIGP